MLVILMVYACQPQSQERTADSNTEHGSSLNKLPSVEVVNPSSRSFNSDIVITGSIKADQSVVLHAMEQGFLKSISVDIGDKVTKGQTLARLSNPMLGYELKMAEVKVKEAQAKFKTAEAKLKLNDTDASIKQGIFDRIKAVYDQSKGLTTLTELDNAQRDAEMAKAQQIAAIAELDMFKAEISAAESMKSAIAERQNMLSIKAPFSGVITGRFVDPGAMVQNALASNNAMPIVSIEAVSPIRLSLPLPESDIAGIKVGDEVAIEFPNLSSANTSAKISRIAKSLDAASKTMEVQVDLPNKGGEIKAGMYAKAMIKRASSKNSLSLPHATILMRKDAPFVMLVKDDKVEEIALHKGISGKDYFEVLNSNISKDSRVITKGKSSVKSGERVKAILK